MGSGFVLTVFRMSGYKPCTVINFITLKVSTGDKPFER